MPKSDPVLARAEKERATASMETLGENLSRLTKEGELYEKLPDGKVRCYACGHRCLILEGHDGICRVRFNRDGKLFVPWNYFGALQCDPSRRSRSFHALPGTLAMSFGMLGCDLHCGYCQNWFTSQALRDPRSTAPAIPMTAEGFVELAIRQGADTVTSTYNEPLITSEWGVEVFKEACQQGLCTSYVSNGNGTEEVLDYIKPWVDFYKGRSEEFQRQELPSTRRQTRQRLEDRRDASPEGFLVGDRHAVYSRLQRQRGRDAADREVPRGHLA